MKRLAPLLLATALCLSGCGASDPVAPAADPTPIAAPTVPPTNTPTGDLEGCLAWIEETFRSYFLPEAVSVEYSPDTCVVFISLREDHWVDKIAERDADWWGDLPEAYRASMEYIIFCAEEDYGVTGVDYIFQLYCGTEIPLAITNTTIAYDYMAEE